MENFPIKSAHTHSLLIATCEWDTHSTKMLNKENVRLGTKLLSVTHHLNFLCSDHSGSQLPLDPLLIFKHSICTWRFGVPACLGSGGSHSKGPGLAGAPGQAPGSVDNCHREKEGEGARVIIGGTTSSSWLQISSKCLQLVIHPFDKQNRINFPLFHEFFKAN